MHVLADKINDEVGICLREVHPPVNYNEIPLCLSEQILSYTDTGHENQFTLHDVNTLDRFTC